jgi:hypothetical protein
MRTSSNVATVKIDISHMADGQFAGLTHFSTTGHSLFGIRQENEIRSLVYRTNGKVTSGIRVKGSPSGSGQYGMPTELVVMHLVLMVNRINLLEIFIS